MCNYQQNIVLVYQKLIRYIALDFQTSDIKTKNCMINYFILFFTTKKKYYF